MRQWLIDIRVGKNLSQKAVCDAIGISQPTYWEYEHGESTPTPKIAMRLGEFLGFDWTRFYREVDQDDAGGAGGAAGVHSGDENRR